MEGDIELIIVTNTKRVIGEMLLKEASQSFAKIGEDELSFLKERILLDCVLEKLWRQSKRWRVLIK